MDQEERDRLERILELTEENNRILKKMERMGRINTIIRAVYWVIVAGAAIGLFYYVQEYLDAVVETYSGFGELLGS